MIAKAIFTIEDALEILNIIAAENNTSFMKILPSWGVNSVLW